MYWPVLALSFMSSSQFRVGLECERALDLRCSAPQRIGIARAPLATLSFADMPATVRPQRALAVERLALAVLLRPPPGLDSPFFSYAAGGRR